MRWPMDRPPEPTTPMAVVAGVDALTAERGPVFIVVGVFDGLHLGHAYLLRRLAREARHRGARGTVVTFDHHPDEILVGRAPALLCDPAERLERLAAAGVETTVVQHFDQALRTTEYDTFIGRIAARVEIAGFLMTPDAAFGHERRGTPAAVSALGDEIGFEVLVVPPFTLDGGTVRSTDVRDAIAAGDLARAERLLGRPVAVVGAASAVLDRSIVSFALPVALPPSGRYGVVVRPPGMRSVRARALVAGDLIELDRPFDGPLRIVFA